MNDHGTAVSRDLSRVRPVPRGTVPVQYPTHFRLLSLVRQYLAHKIWAGNQSPCSRRSELISNISPKIWQSELKSSLRLRTDSHNNSGSNLACTGQQSLYSTTTAIAPCPRSSFLSFSVSCWPGRNSGGTNNEAPGTRTRRRDVRLVRVTCPVRELIPRIN